MNSLKVWLAYVAYPVTTAAYFERALRKLCHVTTIGPPLPPDLIEKWQLQNLKLPLREHEISTGFKPDMLEILSRTTPEQCPDLYLWVESVGGHYPLHLDSLGCPKACYLIDSHLNLPTHLEWARHFDLVFIAQREYLDEFRRQGMRAHWLPLGCDPDIHCCTEPAKKYPIGFVGGVQPGSRREKLLATLSSKIPVHYERCFWDDMARLFTQSKIVFNEAIRNDLNMRVFEVMSTGSLLLTDMARNSGQDELFIDGEDYAVYKDQIIFDVAKFYLDNETLRDQIAERGRKLVHNAHSYAHRMEDLLAVALRGKPDTFSAAELRDRSLAGIPSIDAKLPESVYISNARRSFVIPVLDMSPASEYNICTLLKDLEHIDGDVIVVFNGQEVAEHLKGHPRITRYAIMKHNIGVARAWNLGLEIAATPTVFILNADLHINKSAIDTLQTALYELPGAACVGPQGCFYNFDLAKDYIYFDKGTFDRPLCVDAVSGFLFAIKLQHFNEKIIRFENGFTPCFFEEWDLGLQIRKAGLLNYIVPTDSYVHHWSGSIRALREIAFYEKSDTAGEILSRNRRLFLNKWRGIAAREDCREILTSGFFSFAEQHAYMLISEGLVDEAGQWLDEAMQRCQDSTSFAALQRFIAIHSSKTAEQISLTGETHS
jgi:hypothetical protein